MAVSGPYVPANCYVYMGLSTDTKPASGIGNKFIETDTGKVFLYTNAGTWIGVGTLATASAGGGAVTI